MDLATTEFTALGTIARVVTTDNGRLDAAVQAVRTELEAIDLACSRFRPDSELSRLNAAGGATLGVSPLFAAAIEAALRASRLTDGVVDPTVGDALIRLGYDRDFEIAHGQTAPVSLEIRPTPGWQLVQLDRVARTVRLHSGVILDRGATAKALACDRSAEAAASAAGCGVLVSLGGDIAVAGKAPAEGWTVLVTDDSHASIDGAGQRVRIVSGGLATSSTTVRHWCRGGASLHHIIDPRTGLPAQPCWRTVSTAAGTCVDANTAATAAVVLGLDAPRWLEAIGLPARLVAMDGAARTVCGWPSEPLEEQRAAA